MNESRPLDGVCRFSENNLRVQSEAVDLPDANHHRSPKQGLQRLHTVKVIGGVFVRLSR